MERCESCGLPFIDHKGIIGTCAELQKLKISIERKDVLIRGLRLRLKEFEFEHINRNKAEGRVRYGHK